MTDTSLVYQLPFDLGLVEFMPSVLAHFTSHKQRYFTREAGGQLFAYFDDPYRIKIVEVTGPRGTDKRSLFGYRPDRLAEKVEIAERYTKGLHFIGDWHSHCEKIPTPSPTDKRSMREMVLHSSHDLAGFIMVIVGQAEFPEGLHVSFHSNAHSMRLTLVKGTEEGKRVEPRRLR